MGELNKGYLLELFNDLNLIKDRRADDIEENKESKGDIYFEQCKNIYIDEERYKNWKRVNGKATVMGNDTEKEMRIFMNMDICDKEKG